MAVSILFTAVVMFCANSRALAAAAEDGGRCSGVTLEKAAAFLAVSPDDLQKNSSDLMVSPEDIQKKIYKVQPYNCSIRSKSNFLKSITYVTYAYNDKAQARAEFNKMKKGFESVTKVDIVPDISDEVFWVGDTRFQRMVAIKDAVVIDVLNPKDFDLQKQIMSLVVGAF
jgi:hypothetical protein